MQATLALDAVEDRHWVIRVSFAFEPCRLTNNLLDEFSTVCGWIVYLIRNSVPKSEGSGTGFCGFRDGVNE